MLPRDPVLCLRAIDYRLWLGPCSLPCAIQPVWSKVVDLPAGMTTVDALRALMEEDFEDIAASRFAPYVQANQRTLLKVIEEEMKEQGLLDFDEPLERIRLVIRRHDARGDAEILGRAVAGMLAALGLEHTFNGVPRHRAFLPRVWRWSHAPPHSRPDDCFSAGPLDFDG